MFEIFKNKAYWLYLGLVALIIMLFSFAMVGSRSTVKVQQIPVAVVDQDHSNASRQIVSRLKARFKNDNATLKLTVVKNQKQLSKDLNHKKYYGAIIIKQHFGDNLAAQTKYLQSMVIAAKTSSNNANASLTPLPDQATIEFKVNAGANATVSSILNAAFAKMGQALSAKVSQQELSVLGQNNVSISTSQLSFLSNPIKSSVTTVHKIKDKTISGMLPMLLTALSWIAGLITSILLWREHKKMSGHNVLSAKSVTGQILGGGLIIIVTAVVFDLLGSILNLYLPSFWIFVGTFTGIAFIFYLIQACILDCFGIKGWPLLIVVWLFGMGTMSYIPQMLNPAYRFGIYSWIPMRFALDIYDNMLYYANVASTSPHSWLVLGSVGLGALILMYLSSLRKER